MKTVDLEDALPAIVVAQEPTGKRAWRASLCGCFSDPGSCLLSFLLPSVLFGMNQVRRPRATRSSQARGSPPPPVPPTRPGAGLCRRVVLQVVLSAGHPARRLRGHVVPGRRAALHRVARTHRPLRRRLPQDLARLWPLPNGRLGCRNGLGRSRSCRTPCRAARRAQHPGQRRRRLRCRHAVHAVLPGAGGEGDQVSRAPACPSPPPLPWHPLPLSLPPCSFSSPCPYSNLITPSTSAPSYRYSFVPMPVEQTQALVPQATGTTVAEAVVITTQAN